MADVPQDDDADGPEASNSVAAPSSITGEGRGAGIECSVYQAEMVRKAAQAAADFYRQRGEEIPPHVRSALNAGRPKLPAERTSGEKIEIQVINLAVGPLRTANVVSLDRRNAVFKPTRTRENERRLTLNRRSKGPEV